MLTLERGTIKDRLEVAKTIKRTYKIVYKELGGCDRKEVVYSALGFDLEDAFQRAKLYIERAQRRPLSILEQKELLSNRRYEGSKIWSVEII